MKRILGKLIIFLVLFNYLLISNLFSQNITLYSKKLFSKTCTEVNEINLANFRSIKYFSLEKNGEMQRIGFLGKNLKPILEKDTTTTTYFKKYKHKKVVFYLVKLSSLGLIATGIVTLLNKNGNNQPFLYYLGGGIGLSIIGIPINYQAQKNLLQAVTLNNNLNKK